MILHVTPSWSVARKEKIMSQNLVAYLEIKNPDTNQFINITNRNTYDGYEFDKPQVFPVINYATPENEIKHARLRQLPATEVAGL